MLVEAEEEQPRRVEHIQQVLVVLAVAVLVELE